MRVRGSPLYRSSEVSSCQVLEDFPQPAEMDRDFLRSWVYVVAAPEQRSTPVLPQQQQAHTRCDKLAHGSFHANHKMRRNVTGASAASGEGYRSFLARLFLQGFGRTAPAPLLQPSHSKSTLSTTPSHFQARSLLSGQVAGDLSTVKIGTNPTALAAPDESRTTDVMRQNTPPIRLLKTATSRFQKKKITNLKSLGVFDFPSSNNSRNHLLKKRHAVLKSKKGGPTVKNLGIFNFDLRSEITNSISRSNPGDNRNNSPTKNNNSTNRCNVVVKTVQSNFTVEVDYWQEVVAKLSSLYGDHHGRTRQARIALGNTYLKWGDYSQARTIFEAILQQLDRSKHQRLMAASMMEKIGLAMAHQRNKKDHTKSLELIKEALLIRYQCVGPLHVDTVETMNVLASVYFCWDELDNARHAYHEVYVLRRAMFGPHHPSVAVTAQELGQVHAKMGQSSKARDYYRQAQSIYDELRIPHSNPSVVSVIKDLQALGFQ